MVLNIGNLRYSMLIGSVIIIAFVLEIATSRGIRV